MDKRKNIFIQLHYKMIGYYYCIELFFLQIKNKN